MSRVQVGKEFWVGALKADGAAFFAAVSEPGALPRPVPSCPDWTVGELTRHLGGFYHRIRLHAGVTGADDRWPPLAVPDEAPAGDDPAVLSWFEEQLAGIGAHLQSLDPDLPTYNWAPRPRVASFWHRRAAHETAVHRWDAQVATRLPEPIEAKLAADTIAEALDTFLPGGRRQLDADVHGLVQLTATDLGMSWYVRLRGTGISLLDTDTLLDEPHDLAYGAEPGRERRVSATASASDLALALWGRIPFEVGEVSGEADLLDTIKIR